MRLEKQSQHLVESEAFPKSVFDELPPESSEMSNSLFKTEKKMKLIKPKEKEAQAYIQMFQARPGDWGTSPWANGSLTQIEYNSFKLQSQAANEKPSLKQKPRKPLKLKKPRLVLRPRKLLKLNKPEYKLRLRGTNFNTGIFQKKQS